MQKVGSIMLLFWCSNKLFSKLATRYFILAGVCVRASISINDLSKLDYAWTVECAHTQEQKGSQFFKIHNVV